MLYLHRSQMDRRRISQETESDHPPHTDKWQDEAEPFLIWHVGHGQVGHGGTRSRRNTVGEGIAEGEGEDRGLTGQAYDVGQRSHDRHGDGRLAGAGGNQDIEAVLDDEHAKRDDRRWENIQHASQEVNDSIHNAGIVEQDGSSFTHRYGQARKHHTFAPFQEGVANVIGRQFADDTGKNPHDEEQSGNFIHVEIKFQNADDDTRKIQP